jgi:hypothetical protein
MLGSKARERCRITRHLGYHRQTLHGTAKLLCCCLIPFRLQLSVMMPDAGQCHPTVGLL